MDLGVLEEFPGRDAREEIRLGQEMVIFALDLAGARRARRAGDRINKIGRLAERVAERRLSRRRRERRRRKECRNG